MFESGELGPLSGASTKMLLLIALHDICGLHLIEAGLFFKDGQVEVKLRMYYESVQDFILAFTCHLIKLLRK